MRGPREIVHLALRIPTLLRTVRRLRWPQARAQVHHALVGIGKPRSTSGDPPRLRIRAPHTPYLPPPAHVRAFGSGRFELLGMPFETPAGDFWSAAARAPARGPLFAYHLHQHEYLRCSELPASERALVIADWIRCHRSGIGWDPHPTGLRLLAWGKLATTAGLLEPSDLDEAVWLRSFADQAETLSQNLEIRLQANHLLSNLLCVVAAGMWVESPESAGWLGRADLLCDEIAAQIRPDGGHEERSPMYHALLLENILDLLNLCRAAPDRAPEGLTEFLSDTSERMLAALEILSHRDGRIALFADTAFDLAPEPAALRSYAERLGVAVGDSGATRGSTCLAQSGYVRLERGDWLLLASVGEPSPPHQPGHAHCDALAFELSLAGRRLVTDTGVFEYLPGTRRQIARSTASHATLQIDGEEQAEIWAAHRVGGRPTVELTAFSDSGEAEATCRGWSRRGTLHRRRYRVIDAGAEIEDWIEGPSREIWSRLPIGPGWSVELEASSSPRAFCRALEQPGLSVEIELPAAFAWRLSQGAYYPSFGREIERPVLIGIGRACAGARTRFRRVD